MSTIECGAVRERLTAVEPDPAVRAHLEACDDCRADADLLALIRAAAEPPPGDLADRIKSSLRGVEIGGRDADRRLGRPRRAWLIGWAAVLVLVAGTVVARFSGASTDEPVDAELVASLEAAPEAWSFEEGVVAGQPVLDGLSDEALERLLEELEG